MSNTPQKYPKPWHLEKRIFGFVLVDANNRVIFECVKPTSKEIDYKDALECICEWSEIMKSDGLYKKMETLIFRTVSDIKTLMLPPGKRDGHHAFFPYTYPIIEAVLFGLLNDFISLEQEIKLSNKQRDNFKITITEIIKTLETLIKVNDS